MAENQQAAVCQLRQQWDIAAQGQAGKGHRLVMTNKILQCSRVLPALGHFTTLNAAKTI